VPVSQKATDGRPPRVPRPGSGRSSRTPPTPTPALPPALTALQV
jgi:hypothetical protein